MRHRFFCFRPIFLPVNEKNILRNEPYCDVKNLTEKIEIDIKVHTKYVNRENSWKIAENLHKKKRRNFFDGMIKIT